MKYCPPFLTRASPLATAKQVQEWTNEDNFSFTCWLTLTYRLTYRLESLLFIMGREGGEGGGGGNRMRYELTGDVVFSI